MITSQFLLPVHLIEEVFRTQEEVINLAALLVPLGGVVDTQLGLLGEKLADVGHRKDYLLHGAIQPYNLDTIRDAAQCKLWPRPLLHPEYALYIIALYISTPHSYCRLSPAHKLEGLCCQHCDLKLSGHVKVMTVENNRHSSRAHREMCKHAKGVFYSK